MSSVFQTGCTLCVCVCVCVVHHVNCLFRFLPSRIGNDDYSSYVLLKGECGVEVNKDTDEENENTHGQSLAEYQTSLMSAVCGGDVSRSVLTFKNTTPHQSKAPMTCT